jgi:hypothetical protein
VQQLEAQGRCTLTDGWVQSAPTESSSSSLSASHSRPGSSPASTCAGQGGVGLGSCQQQEQCLELAPSCRGDWLKPKPVVDSKIAATNRELCALLRRPSTVCPHFLHGHVVSRAVVSAHLQPRGWGTVAITQLSSNGLLTQRVQHICGMVQEQSEGKLS